MDEILKKKLKTNLKEAFPNNDQIDFLLRKLETFHDKELSAIDSEIQEILDVMSDLKK